MSYETNKFDIDNVKNEMTMKLEKYFLLLALGVFAFALQSCDDDDNDGISVPAELSNALAKEHPNAQRIEWETKGAYYVADFHEDNFEKEAWFTKDGVWQMTETDLRYADLPAPVRSSYESSTYYNVWKVEDVDKLERKEMADVYIIEVEKGNQEMDLYYSEDGILVKEVADAHNGGSPEDYLPSDISTAIKDFIAEKYPNARIVDIEKEKSGMTEVEIVHGNISKDVMFTAEGAWAYTTWDISKRHLEDVVKNAVMAAHPGYVIDDADFIETPDGSYFLVEMEQGEREIYVKVTAEGEILP